MAEGQPKQEPTLVGFSISSYYSNETAPSSWATTQLSLAVTHSILFGYSLLLMVVLCISLRQSKRKSQPRKMILLLLGLTTSNIAECIVTYATQLTCLSICTGVASLLGTTYMLSAHFGFRILHIRAKMALGAGDSNIQLLAQVLHYMNYGILFLAVVFPWLGSDLRFFGRYCTLTNPVWVTWLFLLASTGFSLAFLALFIHPLRAHLKQVMPAERPSLMHQPPKPKGRLSLGWGRVAAAPTEQQQHERRSSVVTTAPCRFLQQTIKKNLVYSTVSLTTTIIHISVVSVIATISAYKDSPESAYLEVVPYCATALDLLVNTYSMTMITRIWVPPSWKKFRRLYFFHWQGPTARERSITTTKKTTLAHN